MEVMLSIIIPMYNVEKYIIRCLDSIYNQSLDITKFEVIVVNDGSLDNSKELVQTHYLHYSNLKLISQENKGLSVARNVGLSQAKGQYVWFVDSDDWLAANSLKHLFQYLYNDYKLISSMLIYNWDDNIKKEIEPIPSNTLLISNTDYIKKFPIGAIQRFIIKRELLTENNILFFPGIYHEDGEFSPRLLYYTENVLIIKEQLYHYYQRDNSIMHSWKLDNTLDMLVVVSRLQVFKSNIHKKDYKEALSILIFKILLHSFPYQHVKQNAAVKSVFLKNNISIRIQALRIFFMKGLSIHNRMLSTITILSPFLSIYLLYRKYKKMFIS